MDRSRAQQTVIETPGPPPESAGSPAQAVADALTPAGQAALAAAAGFSQKVAAANTLRAYKADWTQFAQWHRHRKLTTASAPARLVWPRCRILLVLAASR